ncbi:MAG: hypothetical protein COY38_02650 [Candidatus Aenigmarchaeota archaeon CG_4_10_14_0_8_um_filter_37_24]|nr:ROK family protein [Candidatus Aenigmarchaeota archaeon]OIN85287.1 MAG: hypothetical protein AUJ50_05460 [Candidatus Aenigmarchaeota archaeon CG1_02_38_14]PIV68046.1 MAG: hypothetical protein COS07_05480 [Candidatus Aenigmarchaeota archaeon CG01_land_8_20_14_3_00_37_9]PIY35888.1 MAG: hypothetical protein COZ04_01980 [Candidatus Aenigmarchaeota archaeon CG_4_10_14_3_um_filter_37_21]PIZ35270.1 MAG: hypothetical protein COY38_02650 [Candidatus Aenigmarchaeota archaeon CG_4_10_14_0_8_um_filter_3
MPYLYGLDIGGTKFALAFAELDGNKLKVVNRIERPSPTDTGHMSVSRQVIEMTRELIMRTGVNPADAYGYGISSCGPFISGVSIDHPPNLKARGIVPVVAPIRDQLDICPAKVLLANDANAAALAQFMFRPENWEEVRHLIYSTVSSGIGFGAVHDGRLIVGKNGNALECGHNTVAAPDYFYTYDLAIPRQCGCGRFGCLEAYASGNSIRDIAREILYGMNPSKLHEHWNSFISGGTFNFDRINTRDVFEAARSGDQVSQNVVDGAVDTMALVLGHLIHTFDPQAIVIGGGVSSQGENYFGPLRERVNALPGLQEGVYMGPTTLGYDIGTLAPFSLLLDPSQRYEYNLSY